MRGVILYHPKSDHGGLVEDYARDYKMSKGLQLELISLESLAGAEMARIYDVTSYPAVLVIAGGGSLHKFWQGGLPLSSELNSYFHH